MIQQRTRFFIYILVIAFISIISVSLALNLVLLDFPSSTYEQIVEIVSITAIAVIGGVIVSVIVDYANDKGN